MRETPVKQPRASDCQQEDGRPVANGGGHFREEDVLKRRFCLHVPTGIFRFACRKGRRHVAQQLSLEYRHGSYPLCWKLK